MLLNFFVVTYVTKLFNYFSNYLAIINKFRNNNNNSL